MARGARVALQTALGAISGGLGGYQQAQARSKQEERQQRMDLLDLLDRGAIQQAAPGESITGPVPSAIPMAAPQAGAMAEALRTAGPRTSAGSMMLNVGDQQLLMPSKAQRDLQASQRELDAAIQQAEATGAVRMRQERELREETSEKDNRSAYNELVAMGLERGPFQSGRRYTDRLANALKMREITAQRAPRVSAESTLDERVNQRVLADISQMSREGKPGAFGMPATRYTETELATEAGRLRKIYRSILGSEAPAAGMMAAGTAGAAPDMTGAAPQGKPTITPAEAAQLRASGFSEDRIRSQYTVAPTSAPATAPTTTFRDSLSATAPAPSAIRADTSLLQPRQSPRQMMEAAGLQRPSDMTDSLVTRQAARPSSAPRPTAPRPSAPAMTPEAMLAALNDPRALAASRQALASRQIPAGYPMPSVAYTPPARATPMARPLAQVEMPSAPTLPGSPLPALRGSPVAQAMAMAEPGVVRPPAPRAQLQTPQEVATAVQRVASLQSRLALLPQGSARYQEVEQELSVLDAMLREAATRFPDLFTP